jgi:hypothetical protein
MHPLSWYLHPQGSVVVFSSMFMHRLSIVAFVCVLFLQGIHPLFIEFLGHESFVDWVPPKPQGCF